MNYIKSKTCANCGNIDTIELTKQEAAFENLREQKLNATTPCSKCNSLEISAITYPMISFDEEIMDEWGRNKNLYFSYQDEDVILADIDNFDLIIKGLENESYLTAKKEVLLASFVFCYMILLIPAMSFLQKKYFREKKKLSWRELN